MVYKVDGFSIWKNLAWAEIFFFFFQINMNFSVVLHLNLIGTVSSNNIFH